MILAARAVIDDASELPEKMAQLWFDVPVDGETVVRYAMIPDDSWILVTEFQLGDDGDPRVTLYIYRASPMCVGEVLAQHVSPAEAEAAIAAMYGEMA